MKICFFTGDISKKAGTERVSTIIANELAKNGHEVYMLSLVKCSKSGFELNKNIKIISLEKGSGNNKKNFVPLVKEIRQLLKKYKFDILIEVDVMLRIFTVLANLNLDTKIISWEHFNFRTNLGTKLRDIARKIAAKKSDYIITLTETDKIDYEQNLNCKAKVKAIENPLVFYSKKCSSLENKIALSVGRMNYQKGFDMLIEAWAKVISKDDSWILRIAGDGEDIEKIKKQAKELNIYNNVQFLGLINDVEKEYLNASIYIMSSRFEGFPMVLLEAMACGLPVVSFDCHTGPRDMIKNGEDGFLVKKNDTDALAEKVCKLMHDQKVRKKFGKKAKESISRFSLDKIMEKWNYVLEDLNKSKR